MPNSMLMKSRVEILGQREGAPLQWRRTLEFMVDPGVPPAASSPSSTTRCASSPFPTSPATRRRAAC